MKAFSISTIAFLLLANIAVVNNAITDGSGSTKDNGTSMFNGSGTIEDPYSISNITELLGMNEYLDAHFALVNDIDASKSEFSPIGSKLEPFRGTLDGRGHHIINLRVNYSYDYTGLFSYLAEGASVSNLTMFDTFIRGWNYIGGIAGYSEGAITNCRVLSSFRPGEQGVDDNLFDRRKWNSIIEGLDKVGGITGYNTGEIVNCSFSGSIIHLQWKIDDIDGAIFGDGDMASDWMGGIAGINAGGTIRYCSSEGYIMGVNDVGGIAGHNIHNGRIENCYTTAVIDGYLRFSGLVSYNGPGAHIGGSYSACYLLDNYATIGAGDIGENLGTVNNCFFDQEKAGTTLSNGASPRNTSQMMTGSTYTGWDLNGLWDIKESKSYPYFRAKHADSRIITDSLEPSVQDIAYTQTILSWMFKFPGATSGTEFVIETDAKWLSLTGKGVLNGTPGNSDVGVSYVSMEIMDDLNRTLSKNYTLTVINVNDPPVILTYDITDIDEDELYYVRYEALDIDPTMDVLSWSLETDAQWLTIDTVTGVLSGIPLNEDVGEYHVKIMVHDPYGAFDSNEFIITVHNVNDDPIILTEDVLLAVQNEIYHNIYTAIDIDPTDDVLSWEMRTNASFLTFQTDTGLLIGIPSNEDVGSHWVDMIVRDDKGGMDRHNFTLDVSNVNDPPRITTVFKTSVPQYEQYDIPLEAVDPDKEDELVWSLIAGPSWLSIIDGHLAGRPGPGDRGVHWVDVMVEDREGAKDGRGFFITVIPVNTAPHWTRLTNNSIVEDTERLVVDLEASDIDEGDIIIYSLSIHPYPDTYIFIDRYSGMIIWDHPVPGTYRLNVSATDGRYSIYHEFDLTVIDSYPEHPIKIDDIENMTIEKGGLFQFQLTARIYDNASPVFSLISGPDGMLVSSSGGVLWLADSEGTYPVTVGCSDERSSSQTTFNLTVTASSIPGEDEDNDNRSNGDLYRYSTYVLGILLIIALLALVLRKPIKDLGLNKKQEE